MSSYRGWTDEDRKRVAQEAVTYAETAVCSVTAAAKTVGAHHGLHYNTVRSWVERFFPEMISPRQVAGFEERRAAAEAKLSQLRATAQGVI